MRHFLKFPEYFKRTSLLKEIREIRFPSKYFKKCMKYLKLVSAIIIHRTNMYSLSFVKPCILSIGWYIYYIGLHRGQLGT